MVQSLFTESGGSREVAAALVITSPSQTDLLSNDRRSASTEQSQPVTVTSLSQSVVSILNILRLETGETGDYNVFSQPAEL